ncbi:MAG: hypothetical protein Pg6C_04620 [Treponemataceae bacterium]|nr:MAG: hypothetical protein Pg6C_04620 [Treponemataceae bacterium]
MLSFRAILRQTLINHKGEGEPAVLGAQSMVLWRAVVVNFVLTSVGIGKSVRPGGRYCKRRALTRERSEI